ncbi:2Fe-2S iron-sulfur cluster-binding protein [Arthrobacter sp. AZCC_0090]|uniref:2Fe-2S iron-sulfur cluster-binding protein n=1 Tax=Arthrobacter sp. AZCC_0090 TaxID=2735881 RepID=UPI00160DAE5E|nr:2Fe-2S iron-sulfur cluster-binding protein [Arthrobacter sp. AZCC_0090]MBB6407153.1 2Fe-2S ferredoxin [Arthrobacter sp. AZCC_0090]
MPTVRFTTPQGDVKEIGASDGENLMKIAVQNGLPGIEGECGGEMNCATCHVYITEPWKSRMRSASVDENDLLEFDDKVCADSRLGCQVKVTAALDGMDVAIP